MANPTGANQVLTKVYEAVLNAIRIQVVDSVLPSGGATEAKQDTEIALLTQIETNTDGLIKVHAPTRIDYATVNAGAGVSTSAYTQLVASLSAAVKELYIFDSSGRALVLAIGAAASEVDQVYIEPGGTGVVRLAIAAGTRLSIKAVDATANTGQLLVTFLG